MKPFESAVDGYVDAADTLSSYLRRRAVPHFDRDRERTRGFDGPDEFETHRNEVRSRLLNGIGGLPDHPSTLAAETTGRVEKQGYTVETVLFESRPGFHVTANCYVPAGEAPHPGVLFLCGHATGAKADEANQRACIELARNGVVVLIVDPLGQGERRQYVEPETGESFVGGPEAGGVFEHSYAGQGCFYAGASVARWMLNDDRCALTYLREHPSVDPERICVTGTSGGGIQTAFLALLDDRVTATALCCSVTERGEWLATGKRVDAEQVVFGAIPAGFDYDDHVTATAPNPVFVGAAAHDEYFPIEGVHTAVERARRVYDLYEGVDPADRVELVMADEHHCSIYEHGEAIFEWICDVLDAGGYDPVGDHAVLDSEQLDCTADGNVVCSFDDERTIDDLLREYVTGREGGDDRPLRERVVDRLGLDREGCPRFPRETRSGTVDGLDVTRLFFRTERDPDVVCTGVLVSDPAVADETPAVVLFEDGTEALPDSQDEVAALAADHGTVLVFDPRGVGAVRNREIPIPTWHDGYDRIYGTEYKLGYDALLLGESLFGLRVYDCLQACDVLRGETGAEGISLVGNGVGAYHALYAAVADEEGVESVDLRGLGPSFREMATTRRYEYESRLTVFDVLDCDLPHCLDALADAGVSVHQSSRE